MSAEAFCPSNGAHWQPAPIPADEGERLAALRRLSLLDSAPNDAYDTVTRLAAAALNVPTLLISLVDEDRQWFKSRVGLDVPQTGRDVSFCAHAVFQRRPLIVRDAALDPRFAGNPLVVGPPYIRAYMGVPLFTRGGQAIGTLCAIDTKPREFDDDALALQRSFAKIVEEFLHARELAVHTDSVLQYATEREKLFRETFEQAAVGIVHTSLTGALLRINQRMCDMLGYTQEELRELTFVDITHPEDLAKNVQLFQKMLAGEMDSYRLEKRFARKHGDYLWAYLSVALKRDSAGQPDYAIAVIEDISEKKAMEADLVSARDSLQQEVSLQTRRLKASNLALHSQVKQALDAARALRKAENRMRAIANSVPAVIGYWNAELRCESANEAYRDLYGFAPEAVVGMTMRELMGERLFKLNEPHANRALSGESQHFERTVDKADGSCVYCDTQYVPDIDETGHARGLFVLETNITALRKAQLALEDSNAKLAKDSATDYLTGLSNRRIFSQGAEHAATAFAGSGKPYGLILMDLDNFKNINDHFGHDSGDDVLRAVGRALKGQLRHSEDIVARLGGEEFAFLCRGDITVESLCQMAERARAQINKESVRSAKGAIQFTASFGVAISHSDDADWKNIYARADAALYEAKAAGKDRVIFGKSYSKGATSRLRALSAECRLQLKIEPGCG